MLADLLDLVDDDDPHHHCPHHHCLDILLSRLKARGEYIKPPKFVFFPRHTPNASSGIYEKYVTQTPMFKYCNSNGECSLVVIHS